MNEIRAVLAFIGVASLLYAIMRRVRGGRSTEQSELGRKHEVIAAKYASAGLGFMVLGLAAVAVAIVAAWFDALTAGLVLIAIGGALRILGSGVEGFLQGWREHQHRRRDEGE